MRSVRAGIAAILLLAGCGGDDTTGVGDIDVTGTWVGVLSMSLAGVPISFDVDFQLVQTGTSVSGTDVADPSDPGILSGSLEGSSLTVDRRPEQVAGDDCHLFPITLVFQVSSGTMQLESANGLACDGDGVGGHSALDPVTGGSGTLSRM